MTCIWTMEHPWLKQHAERGAARPGRGKRGGGWAKRQARTLADFVHGECEVEDADALGCALDVLQLLLRLHPHGLQLADVVLDVGDLCLHGSPDARGGHHKGL